MDLRQHPHRGAADWHMPVCRRVLRVPATDDKKSPTGE